MPLETTGVVTTLDVENYAAHLLNTDADIRGFLVNSSGGVNTVLTDDPTPLEITLEENTRLVFTVVQEEERDETLGGANSGLGMVTARCAAVLYLYDGQERTPAGEQAIKQYTGILRQRLMQYRTGFGPIAGGSATAQLWMSSSFCARSTTYYTPPSCRMSVTLIDLYTVVPFS